MLHDQWLLAPLDEGQRSSVTHDPYLSHSPESLFKTLWTEKLL